MSETSVIALVAVVVGAVVSVGSVVANLWFSNRLRQGDLDARAQERREDYQEWYRRTLFEKRLQDVQEAYEWLMKFNRGINLADPTTPEAEWNRKLAQYCLDAREWYDGNALFFHESLPGSSEFIGLINAAADYSLGRTEHLRIWDFYHKADAEIRERLREVMAAAPQRRR